MAPSANFSNIYKFYDLINKIVTLGFDTKWRKRAVNLIVGKKILDLGSGTGAAFNLLNDFDVTAIDPDEKMLKLNEFKNNNISSSISISNNFNNQHNVYCYTHTLNSPELVNILSKFKN